MTIEIKGKAAELLASQAAAQGTTVEELVEVMVLERAAAELQILLRRKAAVKGIREFRKHVKPDPDGWTIRDYIDHGRR
ncbi:MAG: hypothetical protein JST65_02500 [Acidobacteria bacterium]|nr:hypothetical protein [Acidobacteriota bacterium]